MTRAGSTSTLIGTAITVPIMPDLERAYPAFAIIAAAGLPAAVCCLAAGRAYRLRVPAAPAPGRLPRGRTANHNGGVTSPAGTRQGATGPGPDVQVFTARLTGRPLLDSDGRALGRIRDVVIWPVAGAEPPRALGLVVQLRRRQIFVPFGRIREVSAEGAQLLGGTVDLDPFTKRAGEMLASSVYGRRTSAGTVADVAIAHRELARNRWQVTALAVSSRRVLRARGPEVVPWERCRELFEPG